MVSHFSYPAPGKMHRYRSSQPKEEQLLECVHTWET